MFDESEKFPEGWFFIKNHNNGYVLMVDNESQETSASIVLSTLRTKNYNAQLWRHDPKGYLVNKKSGQVMDVAKGVPKAGVEIVQQIQITNGIDDKNFQKFGLSTHGHIYLINKPSLVLGIKESFFSRREGLHVHLQLVDKQHLDRKEQLWDFILPIIKEVTNEPLQGSTSSSTNKRTSTIHVKSLAVTHIREDDTHSVSSTKGSIYSNMDQDDTQIVPIGSFPETPFFLKSSSSGLYISIEDISSVSSGTQLTIESLRKKGYESQLWTYETTTHHLINKYSGLILGVEHNDIKDGADIIQTIPSTTHEDTQKWIMSPEGELVLESDPEFVIGFKESWFGNREGAHLHLQKGNKDHRNQKFTVVLPIFKKNSGTNVKVEQHSVFPNGWFFIKSQVHGLVLTVLETGMIAAEIAAFKLDTSNYPRQLWKYEDGYIVNKASNMVLDVRGGSLKPNAKICQYTQKKDDNENQLWALSADGVIFLEANKNLVLTVEENQTAHSKLYLSERKSNLEEQRWNFVLPVFKKKQTTTFDSFRYAIYPSGWFFIRSSIEGSTTESPLVLSAHENSIGLCLLDRQNWQPQLWTYSSGKLINYSTDLAIDVTSFNAGANLIQNKSSSQDWYLTVNGILVYGVSEPKLALSVIIEENNKYRLALANFKYSPDLCWSFLIPEFSYRSSMQTLIQWSIAVLKECHNIATNQLTHYPIAQWPEGEFFIRGPDNLALVPEKSEYGSILIMNQFEIDHHYNFKWTFQNSHLVHCATGLVMCVQDNLIQEKHLQLGSENDNSQSWILRMDGSIISKNDEKFGLGIVQINGVWTVQIVNSNYYSWKMLYGVYDSYYSVKEQKEISRLVSFERIIFNLWTMHDRVERKLVTHTYGVFPKSWVFIRSKCDENLFITVSDSKKGTKLILSKLTITSYRRQLWRYRDDHCIVNFETNYVIDVAGSKLFSNADIIQWSPKFLRSSRKNQVWGLTVHGHIHPKFNSDLVLSPVGNHVREGAELKLIKRGNLSLDYQQWMFATPIFQNCTYASYEAQQAHKDSLKFEGIGSTCSLDVSSHERYERIEKDIVVLRWGVFPQESFFIRCAYGDKHLALTAEYDEASITNYKVVIRSLDFKAYKLQLWSYQNGNLINEETGLVLDAQSSEDISIEDEQTQVYLKQKASNEGQFWDLGVNGEIHLRSNQRLAIGANNADDASVEGAQIGIKKINVLFNIIDDKKLLSLKSEEWVRWSFSKPVFGKRVSVAISENESGLLEIEKCEDCSLTVKEEVKKVNNDEEEEFEEVDKDEELDIQASIPEGVATIVDAGNVATIASDVDNKMSTSSSTVQEHAIVTDINITEQLSKPNTATIVETASAVSAIAVEENKANLEDNKSSKSQHQIVHNDSSLLENNYVPTTGFEKIDCFELHQNGFPSGYFFIKSSLCGYVLDATNDAKEDRCVTLTKMRSKDFNSQLWSFDNGSLINFKGRTLVLDAVNTFSITGERVYLTVCNSITEDTVDQVWGYSAEGIIYLKAKSIFILSLEDTKRSNNNDHIDVYVQQAKAPINIEAHPKHCWEILVPSIISANQQESNTSIIESSKTEKVTSSAYTFISYKWLKETYCYKIAKKNQWSSTENWFFIRFGSENHFLASGETSKSQVSLCKINPDLDYRRFLWVYINGYLINYKYLLRLVLNNSHHWVLSNTNDTLNQKFSIDINGSISVTISKIDYYINHIHNASGSCSLTATIKDSHKECQDVELHIPIISDTEYQKDAISTLSSVKTWICKQTSDWAILTGITTRERFFPESTWFFVKVAHKKYDNLVLSVHEANFQLVLKELDFKSFQDQLWTYNDNHLINYGSKYVIDVQDKVSIGSKLIHTAETKTSTQKWILNAESQIELDNHDFYILGCDAFKDGACVLLGSSRASSHVYPICWKFFIPVFRKSTTSSEINDITQEIANVSTIESVEDISSSVKPQLSLIRKVTKHTFVTYREILLIISWWRIVFTRRLSSCCTQKEYLEVIEKYRQNLYNRFNHYISVYGSSLSKKEFSALEASLEEIRNIFETEVFIKLLNYFKEFKAEQFIPTTTQHDLSIIVFEFCNKIDEKYKTHNSNFKKEEHFFTEESSTFSSLVHTSNQYISELEAANNILITFDIIHVTIRYWFRLLYKHLTQAFKDNMETDRIQNFIQDSYLELQVKLNSISKTIKSALSQSIYFDEHNRQKLEQIVNSAIQKLCLEIEHFIHNQDVIIISSIDQWDMLVFTVNVSLTSIIHEYKYMIQKHIVSTETDTDMEETIHADKMDAEYGRADIITYLDETKAYITSWFSRVYEDINWIVNISSTKQDIITVIDASELELVSKIDEYTILLSVLLMRTLYLSWSKRRYLISFYTTIKVYILFNLKKLKEAINDEVDKELILEVTRSIFGEKEQIEILKNIDFASEIVSDSAITKITTDTQETFLSSSDKVVDGIASEVYKNNPISDINFVVADKHKTINIDIITNESTALSKIETSAETIANNNGITKIELASEKAQFTKTEQEGKEIFSESSRIKKSNNIDVCYSNDCCHKLEDVKKYSDATSINSNISSEAVEGEKKIIIESKIDDNGVNLSTVSLSTDKKILTDSLQSDKESNISTEKMEKDKMKIINRISESIVAIGIIQNTEQNKNELDTIIGTITESGTITDSGTITETDTITETETITKEYESSTAITVDVVESEKEANTDTITELETIAKEFESSVAITVDVAESEKEANTDTITGAVTETIIESENAITTEITEIIEENIIKLETIFRESGSSINEDMIVEEKLAVAISESNSNGSNSFKNEKITVTNSEIDTDESNFSFADVIHDKNEVIEKSVESISKESETSFEIDTVESALEVQNSETSVAIGTIKSQREAYNQSENIINQLELESYNSDIIANNELSSIINSGSTEREDKFSVEAESVIGLEIISEESKLAIIIEDERASIIESETTVSRDDNPVTIGLITNGQVTDIQVDSIVEEPKPFVNINIVDNNKTGDSELESITQESDASIISSVSEGTKETFNKNELSVIDKVNNEVSSFIEFKSSKEELEPTTTIEVINNEKQITTETEVFDEDFETVIFDDTVKLDLANKSHSFIENIEDKNIITITSETIVKESKESTIIGSEKETTGVSQILIDNSESAISFNNTESEEDSHTIVKSDIFINEPESSIIADLTTNDSITNLESSYKESESLTSISIIESERLLATDSKEAIHESQLPFDDIVDNKKQIDGQSNTIKENNPSSTTIIVEDIKGFHIETETIHQITNEFETSVVIDMVGSEIKSTTEAKNITQESDTNCDKELIQDNISTVIELEPNINKFEAIHGTDVITEIENTEKASEVSVTKSESSIQKLDSSTITNIIDKNTAVTKLETNINEYHSSITTNIVGNENMISTESEATIKVSEISVAAIDDTIGEMVTTASEAIIKNHESSINSTTIEKDNDSNDKSEIISKVSESSTITAINTEEITTIVESEVSKTNSESELSIALNITKDDNTTTFTSTSQDLDKGTGNGVIAKLISDDKNTAIESDATINQSEISTIVNVISNSQSIIDEYLTITTRSGDKNNEEIAKEKETFEDSTSLITVDVIIDEKTTKIEEDTVVNNDDASSNIIEKEQELKATITQHESITTSTTIDSKPNFEVSEYTPTAIADIKNETYTNFEVETTADVITTINDTIGSKQVTDIETETITKESESSVAITVDMVEIEKEANTDTITELETITKEYESSAAITVDVVEIEKEANTDTITDTITDTTINTIVETEIITKEYESSAAITVDVAEGEKEANTDTITETETITKESESSASITVDMVESEKEAASKVEIMVDIEDITEKTISIIESVKENACVSEASKEPETSIIYGVINNEKESTINTMIISENVEECEHTVVDIVHSEEESTTVLVDSVTREPSIITSEHEETTVLGSGTIIYKSELVTKESESSITTGIIRSEESEIIESETITNEFEPSTNTDLITDEKRPILKLETVIDKRKSTENIELVENEKQSITESRPTSYGESKFNSVSNVIVDEEIIISKIESINDNLESSNSINISERQAI
ncbi:uncharacterized protein BX663DRAFT_36301 [Cokeromyces recurvatus]|uniref:uncharacterized protein n=1 Tax=Cokeromyces recurvatus TaxID=90255 RepID=UPI002220F799|nr:uncharacterized protein BX663DRAFT_36301 [Cokeromyces recurvatus]KAI7903616.1 hypothetical protein BX663DRAFT_36301 [Cokeromyces recurvatus]